MLYRECMLIWFCFLLSHFVILTSSLEAEEGDSDLTEDEEMPEQQKKSRLESNCPPAMYECRSGECIYPKHLCDGEDDCQDGEDEKNCPDKPKPKKKKVAPPPKKGKTTQQRQRRDQDPPIGPDFECPRKLFTCDNKECILPKYQCDGERDCSDGSDENNCGRPKPKHPPKTPPKTNEKTTDSSKKTKKTKKKTKKSKTKKGKKTKKDNKKEEEEEEVEDTTEEQSIPDDAPYLDPNFKCPKNLFTCKNKECILENYNCDGKRDCSDGSDELDCPFDFSQYEEYLREDPDSKEKPPYPPYRGGSSEEDAKPPKPDPPKKPPRRSEESRRRSYKSNVDPDDVPDDFVCPHNLFTCNNKECVNGISRCDGTKHCSDGSDEWNCGRGGGEL